MQAFIALPLRGIPRRLSLIKRTLFMNYYSFIAGLPDITPDNAKDAPQMDVLLEELEELLSDSDRRLLKLLRMRHDNENLTAFLADKTAEMNPLGNLTKEDWEEVVDTMENGTEFMEEHEPRIVPYIAEYYHRTHDEKQGGEETAYKEELLATLYYDYGMKCRNKFVSRWFEFSLNLNNILTAYTCRKHGWDIKSATVGHNEVAETIRKNPNARDFGLKGVFDDYDEIASIAEMTDLMERERRIDAIKWQWIEEQTFFEHFSIEKVLSFWLKCEMVHRWDGLDTEKGKSVFKGLLQEMKKGIEFAG